MDFNDLEFFETEDGLGPAKATVHSTGKLGFSTAASKLIDFETNRYFKIGRRKEAGPEVLFMLPVPEEQKDEFTFQVYKAGGYYSMKTKRLMNQLGIDYREGVESVIFEVDQMSDGGDKKYYRLTKRKKRSNNTGSTA